MPPYLLPIYQDRCVKCGMVATHKLYNERNAYIAAYCKIHAPTALESAKADFLARPR